MAEPRVKNSRVRLVTSDREEEALQVGGEPFRVCRFTSDQGIPVHSRHRCYKKPILRYLPLGGGGGGGNKYFYYYACTNATYCTCLHFVHKTLPHMVVHFYNTQQTHMVGTKACLKNLVTQCFATSAHAFQHSDLLITMHLGQHMLHDSLGSNAPPPPPHYLHFPHTFRSYKQKLSMWQPTLLDGEWKPGVMHPTPLPLPQLLTHSPDTVKHVAANLPEGEWKPGVMHPPPPSLSFITYSQINSSMWQPIPLKGECKSGSCIPPSLGF